jgi:hypothetical protein
VPRVTPAPASTPASGAGRDDVDPAILRARIDRVVKAANAALGPNQRIHGWRLWPDEDFPRTHTLKIKRGPVRAWAVADTPPGASGPNGSTEDQPPTG